MPYNKPQITPTESDMHRAAAWWAAEGSIFARSGRYLRVTIAQKEADVTSWVRARFGGSVWVSKGITYWHLDADRARTFALSIYRLIPESPRRRAQIKAAILATPGVRKTGNPASAVCRHGHTKPLGGECKVCRRMWQRAYRSIPENAEKHRRKQNARYWRNKQQVAA
jgi:hypothetical protein